MAITRPLLLACTLLFLLPAAGHAQATDGVRVQSWETGWSWDPSVLNNALWHYLGPADTSEGEYRVVYSQRVTDLQAGDVVKAVADLHVTEREDHDGWQTGDVFAINVRSYLTLATSPTSTGGTRIGADSDQTVSYDHHHGQLIQGGMHQVAANNAEMWVNLVVKTTILPNPDETDPPPAPWFEFANSISWGKLGVTKLRPTAEAAAPKGVGVKLERAVNSAGDTVSITTSPGPAKVVLSRKLEGVGVGETIDAFAQAGAFSDYDYRRTVTTAVVIGSSATDAVGQRISPLTTFDQIGPGQITPPPTLPSRCPASGVTRSSNPGVSSLPRQCSTSSAARPPAARRARCSST